jgi:hypothetical protein
MMDRASKQFDVETFYAKSRLRSDNPEEEKHGQESNEESSPEKEGCP